jgi:hypothetical protein
MRAFNKYGYALRTMHVYGAEGQKSWLGGGDHGYGKPYAPVDLEKDTTIL